ncbi:unnamed protein product [Prorocentrum cordatum]|uniref:CSD domain-containing protein n=1 Tax=Prorocentrum cordatum TaxID=2364126 RepID=A0ABN9T151_9DINO|nr:unnamed protein product [Polarella glacialis]
MSGTRLWRPTYQGRIRSYSQQKGFGFIDCQESLRAFGRDVFIHRFQMEEAKLTIAQEVVFEVELNKTGCPQARNVRPASIKDHGDMSGMGGWGGMGMGGMGMGHSMGYGGQQGMCSGMGAMGGKGALGGDWGKDSSGGCGQGNGQPDTVEEMLRNAQGSSRLWEIIETHGHTFQKGHVVTALYQMGLCRNYERRNPQSNLSATLAESA